MHLLTSLLPLILSAVVIATSPQTPLREHHPTASELPLSASDFTTFHHATSPNHSIRTRRQNASLCDTPVDQYTGWLDVGHQHLFFWYFAAEHAATAPSPLALWMTGGPGGSSMLDTAMTLVDQPVGVGFSYADDEGEKGPDNSFASAVDMHLFLQMFISQVFPVHMKGPFVITGESYAGHYIPTLGSQIVTQSLLHPHRPQVPLKSVVIGNGLISRADTIFGYWETLCTTNPGVAEPVLDETRCDLMAAHLPRCMEVLKTCDLHPDPAQAVCFEGVVRHYDSEDEVGGRDPYDITTPCIVDVICYQKAALLTKYLNLESSFNALGVPPSIKNYTFYSIAVEKAFQLTVDIQISTEPQIRFLLAHHINVLLYQGSLDLACNTGGNKRWATNFAWKGQAEFAAKEYRPWTSIVDGRETRVGMFKEVNIKVDEGDEETTRFALVTVDNTGHYGSH